MTIDPARVPVIAAVGEHVDRPADPMAALEPVALMAEALLAAERDAGVALLPSLEAVDLVGLVSWRYVDPVGLLCNRLGIDPARRTNSSMGGETPMRLIHDAALAIARGEVRVAAVVGGEATQASNRAKRDKLKLPWTQLASKDEAVRFPSSSYAVSPPAKAFGMRDPAQIYPFYEMATQSAWGQSPAQALQNSADLWAAFAAVAAENPAAWIRTAPDAATIGTVSADNRLINWPYPKLMVANPSVNQAAAVIVMSLAAAREAGIPEENLIFLWGGAAAKEPEDYLLRDSYAHSTAQEAVLERANEIAAGVARLDLLELYSCFPVVPKMALRALGIAEGDAVPTITGGLTFFGAPLNNYMTHATVAMVRSLRERRDAVGLLYGQGGYVNNHHALVVSATPSGTALASTYSVQEMADARRGEVPALVLDYSGPATIETYTVRYDRSGAAQDGIVIARTPARERLMAMVAIDDTPSMALLQSTAANAIGSVGHVRRDPFGNLVWEVGEMRDRRGRGRSFTRVERDGPLTIVTINRPEAMNATHPATNAELAEIFDEFAADPEQWVAILTGAGTRAFSAGNDLKFMAEAAAKGQRVNVPLTGFGGLTSRFDLDKPVIAAVNGIAMGGGFEIALACDIVIAVEDAVFAFPEPKVGLAALAGGLHRLPLEIGLKRAMGILLTGRHVSAREGETLGFVNEVVSAADLMATARRWAHAIMKCSPMSIRASKQAVRLGLGEASIEDAYRNQSDYPALRALFRSADFREGPLAFAQKRSPRWTGQ